MLTFIYKYAFILTIIQTLKILNIASNQIECEGVKHLANALKHNTVFLHQFQFYASLTKQFIYSTIQALTTLYLGWNKIEQYSALYLADSLKDNTVYPKVFFMLFFTSLCQVIQTLTTLNLAFNQIGDIGAQHLADALEHNKVIPIFCCCTFKDLYNRRLRH